MKNELHLKLSDNLKRKYYLKFEIIKYVYKSFLKNDYLNNLHKYYIYLKFSSFFNYSSKVYKKNRCIVSGRRYGLVKYFKLSRFFFRKNVLKLNVSGLKRRSW